MKGSEARAERLCNRGRGSGVGGQEMKVPFVCDGILTLRAWVPAPLENERGVAWDWPAGASAVLLDGSVSCHSGPVRLCTRVLLQ